MKVYSVKVQDFAKLTNNKNLLTSEQKQALEKYESLLGIKSDRFLARGKDIVLIIAQGKYYITSKPVYQKSISDILESVGIDKDLIQVMDRQSSASVNISIEQLRNLLLAQ